MVPVPLSRLQPYRTDEIEDWPRLNPAELRARCNRQVCMVSRFFSHHPGPGSISLLTCNLGQGLSPMART